MTVQAKFSYSFLGKAFEKQIKTNENPGEKQIKAALEEHGKQLVKYNNEKESSTHSKHKQIYEELSNKRIEEMQDLSKKIDFDNLTYCYKANNNPKTFIDYKGPLDSYTNIKEGYIH